MKFQWFNPSDKRDQWVSGTIALPTHPKIRLDFFRSKDSDAKGIGFQILEIAQKAFQEGEITDPRVLYDICGDDFRIVTVWILA